MINGMATQQQLNEEAVQSRLYDTETEEYRAQFIERFRGTKHYDRVKKLVSTAKEARLKRKQKLAWVLSPGLLRGWFEFGTMDVLYMLGLDPDMVVGSSIGSYVGIVPATRTPISFVQIAHKEYSLKAIFGKSYYNLGLFDNEYSLVLLKKNFGKYALLEELPVPLYPIATHLNTREPTMFEKGDTFKAIAASMAHPMFPPVQIDGEWYSDGGIVDPMPTESARKLGANKIIAIDAYSETYPGKYTPPTPVPMWARMLLRILPNNQWRYVGRLYLIFKLPFIARRAAHEFLWDFQACQNQVIKRSLELTPPDLYIDLCEAMKGRTEIPLTVASFKKSDHWIEHGRQAVCDFYLEQLMDLREELDK